MDKISTYKKLNEIHIYRHYKWFSKIDMYIGKPIDYSEFTEKLTADDLQKLANELMNTINNLDNV